MLPLMRSCSAEERGSLVLSLSVDIQRIIECGLQDFFPCNSFLDLSSALFQTSKVLASRIIELLFLLGYNMNLRSSNSISLVPSIYSNKIGAANRWMLRRPEIEILQDH